MIIKAEKQTQSKITTELRLEIFYRQKKQVISTLKSDRTGI